MRIIEQRMVEAIHSGTDFKGNNTTAIWHDSDKSGRICTVRLHGNLIALVENYGGDKGQLKISDAGWQTKTTKSRLNAILGSFGLPTIYQRSYVWYMDLEGEPTPVDAADNTFKVML